MSSKETLNFENAITRLEELTSQLENGSLSLDDSLEIFKEAINLTKFCENKLQNIQKEITIVENSEYIPEEPENDKNKSKNSQNPQENKKKTKKTNCSNDEDDNQGSLF